MFTCDACTARRFVRCNKLCATAEGSACCTPPPACRASAVEDSNELNAKIEALASEIAFAKAELRASETRLEQATGAEETKLSKKVDRLDVILQHLLEKELILLRRLEQGAPDLGHGCHVHRVVQLRLACEGPAVV